MSVLLENSLVTLNTLDLRLKACYTMSLCDLKLTSGGGKIKTAVKLLTF